jgi:hypothetical protein
MRIDVERIIALKAELAAMNAVKLDKWELYENGERVDISEAAIEEWRWIGLNNVEFVTTTAYKTLGV